MEIVLRSDQTSVFEASSTFRALHSGSFVHFKITTAQGALDNISLAERARLLFLDSDVTVEFAQDGNRVLAIPNGVGQQFTETSIDTAGRHVWASRETTYDANSLKTIAQTLLLDDGNTQVFSYANGVLTRIVESDIDNDDDFFSITTTYAADGVTITGRTILLDNGHTQVFTFVGGVATQMVETQVLPDGNTLATTFVNGAATQAVETDTDNDDDFVSITTTYAADGATIAGRTILLDNGNTQVVSYVGGLATQMVETDTDNDDDFVTITTTYAADGVTPAGRTILLDNGARQVFSFVNGVAVRIPDAADDAFSTGDNVTFSGNVFADNGSGRGRRRRRRADHRRRQRQCCQRRQRNNPRIGLAPAAERRRDVHLYSVGWLSADSGSRRRGGQCHFRQRFLHLHACDRRDGDRQCHNQRSRQPGRDRTAHAAHDRQRRRGERQIHLV